MLHTKGDWNIVIIGDWNRAILTPKGIAERLFGLPPKTPVGVLVPLDHYGPYQVKHEEISVIAAADRVIVSPEKAEFSLLQKALSISKRAITGLPETPVTAAGINLRFSAPLPNDALAELTSHPLDNRLSDIGLTISNRSLRRAVKFKNGQLNIHVDQDDQSYSILLNFDILSSNPKDIEQWLDTPIADLSSISKSLFNDYFKLEWNESDNDTNK